MRRVFAAMLCGLLLCPFPAHAAGDAAEAFAALPFLEDPRISPDGTRFASLLSAQGRQMLAILDFDAVDPTVVAIGDNDDLMDWRWVNDEWLVMRLAASINIQGDPWRITRAYGVRASDGKVVSLARDEDAQMGADILWIARDGSPRIMMAVQQSFFSSDEKFYPAVFEVDVSTGKRASRVKPRTGVVEWFTDSDGVVRVGIGYRDLSRTMQVLYREPGGNFRVIDRANAKKGESIAPLPALFLQDTGKALAFSSHEGFDALYELDLQTQQLGAEVFAVPGYDIGGLVTDFSGTELLGVRYTDTRRRTRWLDPVMSKAQQDLDDALGPALQAHIISMSRDASRLIVHAGSASEPGTFYVMDRQRRSLARLGRVQPALQDFTLAPVRTVRYTARDGLPIEAVLTLPAGREPRGLPLLVMPHGGPSARDDESFDWWTQYLAHLGYAVMQPNYRGSSGYGEAFAARGEGQWGLAMQDDLVDALEYLAAEGIADPARACIIGASYGGYAALRAAQRDGARWRCSISFAGVSDLAAMLRQDSHYLNAGALRDQQKRNAPDFDAVSPIQGVEDFQAPVLLVHGRRDLTVHFSQSSTIARKLLAAGKDVRYVELPLGDHHLRRNEDRLTLLREITTFLEAHNPAGIAPGAPSR